jgi:hypothetical protein
MSKKGKKKRPTPKQQKGSQRRENSPEATREAVQRFGDAIKKIGTSKAGPLLSEALKKSGRPRVPIDKPSLVERLTQPPENIAEHIDRLGIDVFTNTIDGQDWVMIRLEDAVIREPRPKLVATGEDTKRTVRVNEDDPETLRALRVVAEEPEDYHTGDLPEDRPFGNDDDDDYPIGGIQG